MIKKLFLIFIIILKPVYPQQGEMITVIGDSMKGKYVSGESLREIYGNVKIVQGNVVITCNQAVQYISRNDAELIGNVIVKQDSVTITTPRGFYYGNIRKAESSSGVKLDDRKVILTAILGEYYFDEDRAFFRQNVKLYDTTTTLTSDSLTYFKSQNRIIAVSNVQIVDSMNVIQSDSLQHFRDTRITFADHNVKITNRENNVVIFGNHLEDYAQKSYTLINKNPFLVQVDTTRSDTIRYDSAGKVTDTTSSFTLDTLIIKSNVMESYRDTLNMFKATDSVEIVRAMFASKNDYSVYYRDSSKIITYKVSPEAPQPVLWYRNSQLTGDTSNIYLVKNRIKLLELKNNSFILSPDDSFPSRFNQIAGDSIKLNFNEGGIYSTNVVGSVYSIYYLYEDKTPNGLIKATSQTAVIGFDSNKVKEVRLYGSPKSEYYPEKQVFGNELTYTLPGFKVLSGRPSEEKLLMDIRKNKYDKRSGINKNIKK